jgi:hypothetical protein
VRLGGQRDPDLVPAAECHLQRRGCAELGVERDRFDVGVLEEPDDRLTLLAGEVEVDSRRGENRAVDDAGPEPSDPAHPLGRDRVGLDEEAFEGEPEDLLGHLLGDPRRTDAEDQVARTDKLLDRADVLEGGGAPSRYVASPLTGPDHLGLHGVADGGAHLTGEEEPDDRALVHRSHDTVGFCAASGFATAIRS